MGEKTERLKRTLKQMGVIFGKMGETGSKILNDMDKKDKELQEKMNKAMGSASKY
jgi:hypothetical protein